MQGQFLRKAEQNITMSVSERIIMKKFEGISVPVGFLDITRHRDDLSDAAKEELAGDCHFPCAINDKTVIIVDDVLYTGRTARAAMEELTFGT